MEQVVWKPVVGFEDRYEVSNDGRVRSIDMHLTGKGGVQRLRKGKARLSRRNNRGYETIGLCRDNKCVTLLVHRLVAQAFISNPYGKPQVNHIDGDLGNNCADNLEWVTDNENKAHSSITEGGTQRPKKAVAATNKTTGESFCFGGLREAERALNLHHKSALNVVSGRQRSTKGYVLKYLPKGR